MCRPDEDKKNARSLLSPTKEVTGGVRATPFGESTLPGVREKRGRREAWVIRRKIGGTPQSRRSSCLRRPGAPQEEAARRRVPFGAKRSTGHGDRCDNARSGQSEHSEVCRDRA